MQTITWQQFYKSYYSIRENAPSYRLGQHFCNLFIRDSDPTTCDPVVKGLWDKTEEDALIQCLKVIKHYHWDMNALPLCYNKTDFNLPFYNNKLYRLLIEEDIITW